MNSIFEVTVTNTKKTKVYMHRELVKAVNEDAAKLKVARMLPKSVDLDKVVITVNPL